MNHTLIVTDENLYEPMAMIRVTLDDLRDVAVNEIAMADNILFVRDYQFIVLKSRRYPARPGEILPLDRLQEVINYERRKDARVQP